MVRSNKFRGVRQRHWGSWVSEIRHPLLKRRLWLGTFETAQEAAKAYDQASILMNGRNAKTNFPIAKNADGDPETTAEQPSLSSSTTAALSEILKAKLQKSSKAPSPSLTCLRLDTESSHIGVWQKRAGSCSNSNWVMNIELEKINKANNNGEGVLLESPSPVTAGHMFKEMDEEERITLQMIEELLQRPDPIEAKNSPYLKM